jgi:hypothetical protein
VWLAAKVSVDVHDANPVIDMRQFTVIVTTLNKNLRMDKIATMFRDGLQPSLGGMTLPGFFAVAEACVPCHPLRCDFTHPVM